MYRTERQTLELICHPANPSALVKEIQVSMERLSPAYLGLSYVVTGDIGSIRLPEVVAGTRLDALWRHTCAEFFIAESDTDRYYEFNFSPSTQWAAYGFTGYRQGMRAIECASPLISASETQNHLRVDVQLQLPPEIADYSQLVIGLSMVIEERSGQCSYWALKHMSQTPDFHHPKSFVANV